MDINYINYAYLMDINYAYLMEKAILFSSLTILQQYHISHQ